MKLKEYMIKNKDLNLFLIVIFLFMIFGILLVVNNNKKELNYHTGYEKTDEYKWFVFGDDCKCSIIDDYTISASWGEESNKVYLQLFDGAGGTMMSDEYKDLATIPEGCNNIQFDCTMQVRSGQTITAYIIQYDDNKRLNEFDKIEKVVTEGVTKDNDTVRNRNYSIKANVGEGAKYFKVLFDIRTNGKPDKLVLKDMDVIFN